MNDLFSLKSWMYFVKNDAKYEKSEGFFPPKIGLN